ncbi:hypothetical protein AAC387_Pa12g1242 [Persea americana]
MMGVDLDEHLFHEVDHELQNGPIVNSREGPTIADEDSRLGNSLYLISDCYTLGTMSKTHRKDNINNFVWTGEFDDLLVDALLDEKNEGE